MKHQFLKRAAQLLLTAVLPLSTGAQNVEFFKSDYTSERSALTSVARGWDNNFFLSGTVELGSGSTAHADILLIKIKPNGDTLWKRTYGTDTLDEFGYKLLTPSGDAVMMAGYAEAFTVNGSTAFLKSINPANGNVLWEKSYPVAGKKTMLVDMQKLNDGYILTGTITDLATNNTDAWLLKTDLNGNQLWHQSYGGPNFDDAWQVERTREGGFMLAGGSNSFHTGTIHDDAWLIKTNELGQTIWIKHYGIADTIDWAWSLAPMGHPAEPTGYLFTGVKNYNPDGSASQLFLMKVDTAGNVVWDKSMEGNFGYREGLVLERTLHNTFYLLGTEELASGKRALLAMDIDTNGNVLNELYFNTPAMEWLKPRAVFINNFNDAYVAGFHILPGNQTHGFAARIRNIDATGTGVAEVTAPAPIYVYPNPAQKECTVISDGEPLQRLILRDALGREVRNISCAGVQYQRVSLEGLAPGTYFFSVFTKGIAPVSLRLVVA